MFSALHGKSFFQKDSFSFPAHYCIGLYEKHEKILLQLLRFKTSCVSLCLQMLYCHSNYLASLKASSKYPLNTFKRQKSTFISICLRANSIHIKKNIIFHSCDRRPIALFRFSALFYVLVKKKKKELRPS